MFYDLHCTSSLFVPAVMKTDMIKIFVKLKIHCATNEGPRLVATEFDLVVFLFLPLGKSKSLIFFSKSFVYFVVFSLSNWWFGHFSGLTPNETIELKLKPFGKMMEDV